MTIHNESPPASTESSSVPTGLKRVVVASMAGTVVEWYEFFLYATAATLVFNNVFFAEGTGDTALIAALLTYGVGFPARSAVWSSDTSAISMAARSCFSSASCSSVA